MRIQKKQIMGESKTIPFSLFTLERLLTLISYISNLVQINVCSLLCTWLLNHRKSTHKEMDKVGVGIKTRFYNTCSRSCSHFNNQQSRWLHRAVMCGLLNFTSPHMAWFKFPIAHLSIAAAASDERWETRTQWDTVSVPYRVFKWKLLMEKLYWIKSLVFQ